MCELRCDPAEHFIGRLVLRQNFRLPTFASSIQRCHSPRAIFESIDPAKYQLEFFARPGASWGILSSIPVASGAALALLYRLAQQHHPDISRTRLALSKSRSHVDACVSPSTPLLRSMIPLPPRRSVTQRVLWLGALINSSWRVSCGNSRKPRHILVGGRMFQARLHNSLRKKANRTRPAERFLLSHVCQYCQCLGQPLGHLWFYLTPLMPRT